MSRELYEKILAGEEVRANLIALKEKLRDEKERKKFAYLLGGDFTALSSLLQAEDPKVRRNAALILGQMESEDLLPVLFDAYEREQTLFVRADYLKAMARMNYRAYVGRMEERLLELRCREVTMEEQKHVSEEMRMLQALILKYRKGSHHKFVGQRVNTELILVVNRAQREATARQIKRGTVKLLAGGVRVKDGRVKDILPIRTWSELLFPLETDTLSAADPSGVGYAVADAMVQRLRELHEGEDAFLFRIELKGKMDPEKKGAYIRRISDAVEQASQGALINSVAEYEVELRLLERKDGTYAAMLKLYTIPEKRFAYRRDVIASSIAPVNAALTAELAKPWMKEKAQVLDPFCGVGTMLIERNQAVPAGTMYGIDIFGTAIDRARANTDRAGCSIYYINKDFFEFEHAYRFDEVITDLPQVTSGKPREEIRQLYEHFFEKIPEHLKEEAVLILYTTEPQLAENALRIRKGYHVEKRFLMNEKSGTSVFVICWKEGDV